MRVSSAMGMVWALLALLCVCTAAEAASHTVGGGAQAQTFRQQGTALMSSQLAFAAHDIAGPDPWRSTPTTPRSHATNHVVRAHDAARSGVRGLVASFAGGEPPAQHSECMSLGQLWSASHTTPPPPSLCGMLMAEGTYVFAPRGNDTWAGVEAYFRGREAAAFRSLRSVATIQYDTAPCINALRYTACVAQFTLCETAPPASSAGMTPVAGVCLAQCDSLAACGFNVSSCRESGGALTANCSTLLPPTPTPPRDQNTCDTPASPRTDIPFCPMFDSAPLVRRVQLLWLCARCVCLRCCVSLLVHTS